MPISPAYPFTSRFAAVHGVRMHYVEQGGGEPIVFLHGNPTWSYLWRNVIPIVAAKGRCIAPDLVGFGKSGKPDIEYGYADHVKYFDGFMEALGLENVTLVLHDWGGAFGFDYALRHRRNVKAIAFLEAVVFTFDWDEFPAALRETFRAFRTPAVGWKLVCEQNAFIERILPGAVVRELTHEEMERYRMPFPTPESRRPIWAMPNMLPLTDPARRTPFAP